MTVAAAAVLTGRPTTSVSMPAIVASAAPSPPGRADAPPTTVEGIERYLGSGMIRGIGPIYAKRLVRAFGEAVFDVIEDQPERLREVDGIGPKRAGKIIGGWADQKVIREIMIFLHSHGVSTSRAVRIFKIYGADAIQVLSENPYRLARDVRGIGWLGATTVAACEACGSDFS